MSRPASENSLSAQIRAILRASATADAPLSAAEIRERLIVMGVEDVEDIYKRLSHLVHRGEIVTTGEVRGKRYWMSDRFTPAPRSPRNKKADGVPTLTKRVLDIVRAYPGVMFAQVRDQLVEQGVDLREGQPSTCLSRLHDRGQIRSEGKAHVRRYFVGDLNAPPVAKPKKAKAVSPEPIAKAAPATCKDSLPVATDTPARKDWHESDDPITRLAASIEDHLTAAGTWSTAMQIAEDLDEDPDQITKAARRLVEAKRAEHRWVDNVREYGVGAPEAPLTLASVLQAHKVSDGGQAETGPLEDSHGPISTAAALLQSSLDIYVAELSARNTPYVSATQRPAYCPAEVRFVPDIEGAKAAQSPAQQTFGARIERLFDDVIGADKPPERLDQSIGWVLRDIEDLVGQACDRHADHRAIKAITTAAFSLSRAIEHLHTAGTAPAPTGVPQS